MKRILPSSDWLLSGQDGSLLPAQDFSVCFHKWISNVMSSLIWIIRIYFRRKIVKHTIHRLRAASLFLQLLVRSVHSRQSVERRTRSVVTEGGKALSCLTRFARQTKKERLLVVYIVHLCWKLFHMRACDGNTGETTSYSDSVLRNYVLRDGISIIRLVSFG